MHIHPVVPVRDMVVFPGVIAPLFVGRPRSVRALEEANARGHLVFITAQKNSLTENPEPDERFGGGVHNHRRGQALGGGHLRGHGHQPAAQAGGHGVPKAKPVPHERVRQRGVRPAHARHKGEV